MFNIVDFDESKPEIFVAWAKKRITQLEVEVITLSHKADEGAKWRDEALRLETELEETKKMLKDLEIGIRALLLMRRVTQTKKESE